MGVSDDDEKRLSARDGHVEAFGIGKEADVVALVVVHERLFGTDGGDDDHGTFLERGGGGIQQGSITPTRRLSIIRQQRRPSDLKTDLRTDLRIGTCP